MNRKTSTIALVGLILIAVIVGLFFLMTDADARTEIDWWSLAFMAGAVLLATLGLMFVTVYQNTHQHALIAGASPVLTLYGVAGVGIAFLFRRFFRESYRGMIALEVILMALALIVTIVLFNNAKRFGASSAATMYASATLGGFVARADTLYKNNRSAPFARSLEQVYEALRYCDHSTSAGADAAIHQQLYELETMLTNVAPPDQIERQAGMLVATVNQRNAEVRQVKAGGI